MNDLSEDKIAYYMLENAYIKYKGKNPEDDDTQDLFPFGWHSNENYNKKIEILSEAINKDVDITETDGYLDIIEGVKDTGLRK